MEESGSLPLPEADEPQIERSPNSLELKELASIFKETKEDEAVVVRILEEALLEPIPPEGDKEAEDEYNAKMAVIRGLVERYKDRSELLKSLWEKIENRARVPNE